MAFFPCRDWLTLTISPLRYLTAILFTGLSACALSIPGLIWFPNGSDSDPGVKRGRTTQDWATAYIPAAHAPLSLHYHRSECEAYTPSQIFLRMTDLTRPLHQCLLTVPTCLLLFLPRQLPSDTDLHPSQSAPQYLRHGLPQQDHCLSWKAWL